MRPSVACAQRRGGAVSVLNLPSTYASSLGSVNKLRSTRLLRGRRLSSALYPRNYERFKRRSSKALQHVERLPVRSRTLSGLELSRVLRGSGRALRKVPQRTRGVRAIIHQEYVEINVSR